MEHVRGFALAAYCLAVLGAIGFGAQIIHPAAGLGIGVVAMLPILAKTKAINTHTDQGDAT